MTPRNTITSVVLGSAILLAACQDGSGPTGPEAMGPAFSAAAAQAGGPDRHALARAIPGFAGLFFEDGQPTVALLDPGQRLQAQRVLAAFLRGQGFSETQLRVRQASFDYPELDAWFEAFWAEAFAEGGVVLADLNETRNAIVIGVEDASRAPQIRAIAARMGIPAAAVVVEPVEPIAPLASLQDVAPSITGGLQIHFGNFLCTLGFIALHGSEESFITNSHCTNRQGGTEGTQYYQPLSSVDPTVIGLEVHDPEYFRGGACPSGARCRYSDSARIRQQSSRSFSRGLIAKTTGANNGSLTIDGSFTVTGEFSQPAVGEACAVEGTLISKVGRTTGWTEGPIVNSCVNVAVSGTNIVQLRQVIVEAGVGSGDSGSPAFRVNGGTDVTLHGILWGGGSTVFVYSPLVNIEHELGDLTVTGGGGGPVVTEPNAPSGLSATAISSSRIDLSWTDNAGNEESFRIQRSSGGSFTTIATVGANTESYPDNGLAANTTYTYRVAACNSAGCSAYVQASATTHDDEPGSGSSMHVADLDGSVNIKGRSGKWEAFVTVRVVDGGGDPVANANVTVSYSGAGAGQASGTTDSSGAITIGTGNLNDGNQVTFVVLSISHSTLDYEPSANTDPDGDSDGTTIIVSW